MKQENEQHQLQTKLRHFGGRAGDIWVLANTREGGTGWERVASCNSVELALKIQQAFMELHSHRGA